MNDFVIYHAYSSGEHGFALVNGNREESLMAKFLLKTSLVLGLSGLLILSVSLAPYFWFALKSISTLREPVTYASASPIILVPKEVLYQPKFDPTLSITPKLIIPAIGVDTEVEEAVETNYEAALKTGVWRVSDFGTPYDRTRPTILAAHRFGYLVWSSLFRKENSFYNLPKLKVGDTVTINWRQRKYVYEVYGENEGENINDYGADLILYTCKDLNSPIRIFKYARLIQI